MFFLNIIFHLYIKKVFLGKNWSCKKKKKKKNFLIFFLFKFLNENLLDFFFI